MDILGFVRVQHNKISIIAGCRMGVGRVHNFLNKDLPSIRIWALGPPPLNFFLGEVPPLH
uniref:Uncharacterized protein n=1 Tax=Picea glauca TaxID=3330 RepID=A0A117NJD2_PICGL|nr:hypothetical protein ABT39_MTgene1240 [Picea glauca]QHR90418.1 hypothetical protein Q903MT_gene4442 [Picea sitchensis]